VVSGFGEEIDIGSIVDKLRNGQRTQQQPSFAEPGEIQLQPGDPGYRRPATPDGPLPIVHRGAEPAPLPGLRPTGFGYRTRT
jgi:hypothetical protein